MGESPPGELCFRCQGFVAMAEGNGTWLLFFMLQSCPFPFRLAGDLENIL